MKPLSSSTIARLRIGILAALFVAVNVGGVLLTRAAVDPDAATKKLDLKDTAKNLTTGRFSQESLTGLFRKNAGDVLTTSGLSSNGDVDTKKIADIVSGSIRYDELTGNAAGIVGKVSGLIETVQVTNMASARASLASFEAELMNRKTQAISDKLSAIAKTKNRINDTRKKVVELQDRASSHLNALPAT